MQMISLTSLTVFILTFFRQLFRIIYLLCFDYISMFEKWLYFSLIGRVHSIMKVAWTFFPFFFVLWEDILT